jgi:predicted Ser/Thr protein kinase
MNLGKYEILNEIGKGGFGTVYRAKDTVLDREVALKVLKPAWLDDSRAVTMFYREARAAAKLAHPCIVTIFDMGEAEGRLYIAMELIDGEPLNARIKRVGGQPLADVLPVIADVASALEVAHKAGITHRDIKPSNILLRKVGRAVLTDFGLVRGGELATMATMSSAGSAMGTPEYVAPEIWEGQGATSASDVYALACVAYEMLTGAVLFAGNSTPAVMRKHFAARDLSRIDDPAVAEVLAAALGADPVTRPGASELVARLRSITDATQVAGLGRDSEIAATRASLSAALASAQWHEAQGIAARLEALAPADAQAAAGLTRAKAELYAVEQRVARIGEARQGLALAMTAGRLDDVERLARELLALVPDDAEGTSALTHVAAERKAAQACETEERERADKIIRLQTVIANYLATGKWVEALQQAEQLLALSPGDERATAALERATRELAALEARAVPLVDAPASRKKNPAGLVIAGAAVVVLVVLASGVLNGRPSAPPPTAPTAAPTQAPAAAVARTATPLAATPTGQSGNIRAIPLSRNFLVVITQTLVGSLTGGKSVAGDIALRYAVDVNQNIVMVANGALLAEVMSKPLLISQGASEFGLTTVNGSAAIWKGGRTSGCYRIPSGSNASLPSNWDNEYLSDTGITLAFTPASLLLGLADTMRTTPIAKANGDSSGITRYRLDGEATRNALLSSQGPAPRYFADLKILGGEISVRDQDGTVVSIALQTEGQLMDTAFTGTSVYTVGISSDGAALSTAVPGNCTVVGVGGSSAALTPTVAAGVATAVPLKPLVVWKVGSPGESAIPSPQIAAELRERARAQRLGLDVKVFAGSGFSKIMASAIASGSLPDLLVVMNYRTFDGDGGEPGLLSLPGIRGRALMVAEVLDGLNGPDRPGFIVALSNSPNYDSVKQLVATGDACQTQPFSVGSVEALSTVDKAAVDMAVELVRTFFSGNRQAYLGKSGLEPTLDFPAASYSLRDVKPCRAWVSENTAFVTVGYGFTYDRPIDSGFGGRLGSGNAIFALRKIGGQWLAISKVAGVAPGSLPSVVSGASPDKAEVKISLLGPPDGAKETRFPTSAMLEWSSASTEGTFVVEVQEWICCNEGNQSAYMPSVLYPGAAAGASVVKIRAPFGGGAMPHRWRIWHVDKFGAVSLSEWRTITFTN